MSQNPQNWRIETDAQDYFSHQKKQLLLADRRPVIRKAADLVGPGIGKSAAKITDYSDLLATFDGYYSSDPGASDSPNPSDPFVGYTLMDDVLGGVQVFTSLATGTVYTRLFRRNPSTPELISWGNWSNAVNILDSPAFTGTPTAPTPPVADSTTKLATTAFVSGAINAVSTDLGSHIDAVDSRELAHFNSLSADMTAVKSQTQAGITPALPIGAAGTTYQYNVVFNPPFTSTPAVVLTPNTTAPDNAPASVSVPSPTGFTINYKRITGTVAFSVNWIAVEQTQ